MLHPPIVGYSGKHRRLSCVYGKYSAGFLIRHFQWTSSCLKYRIFYFFYLNRVSLGSCNTLKNSKSNGVNFSYNSCERLMMKGVGMKILIVDDSKTNLLIASAYLEKMGHQAIATEDPYHCSDLFREEHPDLVILDVVMEGMDGYECARKIRKISKESNDWVPIIFLSSMIDDESVARGIDAGGDDYLSKPFSEVKLSAKIKAMQRIADMRSKLFKATKELKQANEKLNQLSLTDALTGVLNRRAFDMRLEDEWHRASRLKEDEASIALVMIDIDHFKMYNDTFGHQGGDECLRDVGQVLLSKLKRRHDRVFRYGGEEFAVILPHMTEDNAKKVAEEFRESVAELYMPHEKSSGNDYVTISLGVSAMPVDQHSKKEELIKKADMALYAAKEAGRNRVITYSEMQANG